jgi:hypothetical protein
MLLGLANKSGQGLTGLLCKDGADRPDRQAGEGDEVKWSTPLLDEHNEDEQQRSKWQDNDHQMDDEGVQRQAPEGLERPFGQ